MQPEQANPKPQPAPRPAPGPAPQPMRAGPSPAAGRSRRTKLGLGALALAALGFAAVGTGLVHVPGFDTMPTSPSQPAAVTQTAPQQVEEGDHTIGVRIAMLSPERIKAQQINTTHTSGVFFQEVFANSPAERGGLRTNDVILAIDGVPVGQLQEVLSKVRLTPIGQSMSVTVERGGATQQASVTVSRCHLREAPKGPLAPGLVTACKAWTAN